MNNNIKVLLKRRESNVNQTDLAAYLGLNAATIIDIENQRIGITDETADKIVSAIDNIATKAVA